MKRNTIGFLLFVLLTTFPALVMAQEPDSNQEPVSNSNQDIQVPESYMERMKRVSTIMELSLQQSIRMALANNLDIAIENYNEDLNREQIVKTRGFYDPTLSFTLGWNSRENPTTNVLQSGGGIPISINKGFTFDTTLNQNVHGGGALRVLWTNGRALTNSVFYNVNPSYNTNFDISFTQPLWRGFGKKTATERQIKIANLDTEISDTQFKQRVVEIIQQVQNQYWELVYAIENHETQRKSVELAIVQHRHNRKRVEIGVMAPIEITSSHAEVATREQSLIQSEVQIINAQNDLKRMLAPDPSAAIWNLTLIPVDRPRMRDVSLTLQEAIETSIRNRPELERVRLQVEQNEVNRRFYKREGKPTVNLRASFGSLGSAGTVFKTVSGDVFEVPTQIPDPDDPRFGAFGTSWGQVFGFDFTSWGIFFDVTIPLKNRSNNADLAVVAISERQLNSQMKNQQQMVIVEVRNAYETIATRKKSLEAAWAAHRLGQEQLDGENLRFEAGLSTNFEVLRFQRDLANNQVSALRAQVDYELALTSLQKAMYTIIGENDILFARGN